MIREFSFTCIECGIAKTFLLEEADVERWKHGALIQNVFPELSLDDRELMISNTCGKCFDILFADSEDESA